MEGKMDRKLKSVLLDADVIVHFYKGDQILLLIKLFGKRLLILDSVVNELKGLRITRPIIDNFLSFKIAEEIKFPDDNTVITEYARLLKTGRGKGESACMAFLRYNDNILASSNLKDVQKYCEVYNIELITTMDILTMAYENGMLNETECDYFIYNVILKGSKLPFASIKDYLNFKNGKTKI